MRCVPFYGKIMKRKEKVSFFITLVVTTLLLAAVFTAAIIGSLTERSALSVIGEAGLDVFMTGHSHVPPEKTDRKIEKRRRKNADYSVPDICKKLYSFRTEKFDGNEVCYFGEETEKKVIYFHGGSFMWQPLMVHFAYCERLSKELNMQVIMPVYPKAPEYKYDYVLEWLYDYYVTLDGEFYFVGDSAGGGILLSFSQFLADRKVDGAKKLIAISPVLDIALTNPEIDEYAPLDPMLNKADLARKMATYSGDCDVKSPYVSPLYCDYSKLGEVTIITGTHDILYPDTKLLDEKLTSENIKHNYLVYKYQTHVFAIYPMPERTVVLNRIKEIIFSE